MFATSKAPRESVLASGECSCVMAAPVAVAERNGLGSGRSAERARLGLAGAGDRRRPAGVRAQAVGTTARGRFGRCTAATAATCPQPRAITSPAAAERSALGCQGAAWRGVGGGLASGAEHQERRGFGAMHGGCGGNLLRGNERSRGRRCIGARGARSRCPAGRSARGRAGRYTKRSDAVGQTLPGPRAG